MKKVYQTAKYRKWHQNSSKKKSKKNIKRKGKLYDPFKNPFYLKDVTKNQKEKFKSPICAPEVLSLLENTEKTLCFFVKLRNNRHISVKSRNKFIQIDLRDVIKVDFSSLCVLNAIIEDLMGKDIFTRGNFPIDSKIRKKIEESGLLNNMSDNLGNKFQTSNKSELLFIQSGSKKLTRDENKKISKLINNAVNHLTGKANHCTQLRTILLEICGNSIEWGGTLNRRWLLGVKYEDNEVIFTITDVGKGILNTIQRKFKNIISDMASNSNDLDILRNAFIKKYGSSSQEINRNKGLPAIKKGYDDGLILNLKVVTNNVILHFDRESDSKILNKHWAFEGTLYRWVLTKESLENRLTRK